MEPSPAPGLERRPISPRCLSCKAWILPSQASLTFESTGTRTLTIGSVGVIHVHRSCFSAFQQPEALILDRLTQQPALAFPLEHHFHDVLSQLANHNITRLYPPRAHLEHCIWPSGESEDDTGQASADPFERNGCRAQCINSSISSSSSSTSCGSSSGTNTGDSDSGLSQKESGHASSNAPHAGQEHSAATLHE